MQVRNFEQLLKWSHSPKRRKTSRKEWNINFKTLMLKFASIFLYGKFSCNSQSKTDKIRHKIFEKDVNLKTCLNIKTDLSQGHKHWNHLIMNETFLNILHEYFFAFISSFCFSLTVVTELHTSSLARVSKYYWTYSQVPRANYNLCLLFKNRISKQKFQNLIFTPFLKLSP